MRLRALITGASGFVGNHLAERLVREGWEVRALVRPSSDVRALNALNVERALGSLQDEDSIRRAAIGVDVVYHLAATTFARSEAEFEAFLEDAFRHGNTEKYALCGSSFVSQINLWAKNKLQIMQGEKTYGLTILRYISPHGTLNIIKHDLLTGSKYGNYCVVLDMEALTYRYLANSDTSLLPDRQTNDSDGVIEEYLTECGLQMEQEKRHAIASKAAL
jgi:hypothetical protein